MVSKFVRRVRTAPGVVAVQVVTKQGSQVLGVDHVGSAHSDGELSVLLEVADARLRPAQETLDLEGLQGRPARMQDTGDFTTPGGAPAADASGLGAGAAAGPLGPVGPARVVSTSSRILWRVLVEAYSRVGLDFLGDEAFRGTVLARIVEPTSKADSLRVLAEVGAPCPSVRTLYRALRRCQTNGYRAKVATALAGFSARAGRLGAMVMDDVTTLHFEITDEDELRKVGMSNKEHRVGPQVQVGRRRHLTTVARFAEKRSATAALDRPSAQARTSRARSADRLDSPMTTRANPRRSSSDNTIAEVHGRGCDTLPLYQLKPTTSGAR